MFSEERTLFISRKAGVSDLSSLIGCVKECGFDETSYLTANADLQTAGLDPASALFHFLAYGVDEHRDVPGGTLADGLAGLYMPSGCSATCSSANWKIRALQNGCGTPSMAA